MAFLLVQSQAPYTDDNGAPLALGFLYVYDAGTSNPHNTYPDSSLTPGTENPNPLVANAAGRFGPAFIADGASVKVVIKDATTAFTIFSLDDITAPPSVSSAVAARPYSTKNTDYTLQASDLGAAIGVDASGGDRTITANSSTLGNGFWINISKISSAGLVTIQPGGGQTIDGASSLILDTQSEDCEMISQGAAGWHVVSQTAAEPRGELPGINAQTGTTYTPTIDDKGKKITLNNAAPITFTVPPNASVPYPLNSRFEVSQIGAGQVTLAPGAGVSLFSFGSGNANAGWLKILGQNAGVIATKIGTNSWLIEGNLTS